MRGAVSRIAACAVVLAALVFPVSAYAWQVTGTTYGTVVIARNPSVDGTAATTWGMYYRDTAPDYSSNWNSTSQYTLLQQVAFPAVTTVYQADVPLTGHKYWLFLAPDSGRVAVVNSTYTTNTVNLAQVGGANVYSSSGGVPTYLSTNSPVGSSAVSVIGTIPVSMNSSLSVNGTIPVNPWGTMVDGNTGEGILALGGLLCGIFACFMITREVELRKGKK
jgi:hypothetical protein